MVLPTRTWTVSPNNAFSDQTSHLVQFQEACFGLKLALLGAGWTVQSSSNTSIADTSDNWATSADVVLGTSGNGSWIVVRSPVGWIPGSEQIDLLFYVNDTGSNPQTSPIQICPDGYNTDGTTSALPTAIGTQSTVITGGDDIIPWSVLTSGRWNSWYTSQGDVLFGVKQTGQPFFKHFLILVGNTNSDGGGKGNQRWAFGAASSTSADVLAAFTSFGWKGSNTAGTLLNVVVEVRSEIENILSWTNGYDYKGETKISTYHIFHEAGNGRHLGSLGGGDVFAGITTLGFGTLDDIEDAQTLRRVCITTLWVFFPTASLPIQ